MPNKFQHFRQKLAKECGAVCLQMIAQYYGRHFHVEKLMSLAHQSQSGASLLGISEAAEAIGMQTVGAKMTFRELQDDIPLPGIAHWRGNHFVVVVELSEKHVLLADPAAEDTISLPVEAFLDGWVGKNDVDEPGIILLMEPTSAFYSRQEEQLDAGSVKELFKRFLSYKGLVALVGFSLLASLFLMFLFPFLFKTMVDKGVESQAPAVLLKVMGIWVLLFLCKATLNYFRNAILSFIGKRVNLQMLIDFMRKIMRLPLGFFHSRKADDVIQLLYDNTLIQRFLTNDLINVLYSALLLLIYAGVMAIFSWKVFGVFVVAVLLQLSVTLYLLKKRKQINYYRLEQAAAHFHLLNELLRGIQAIRLNSAGLAYRWAWERSEVRFNSLTNDWQKNHDRTFDWSVIISELRNILIIYLALLAVTTGQISIGALVAILFILTQVGQPFQQLVNYFLAWQDIKSTFARMDYIRNSEELDDQGTIDVIPSNAMITGEGVSFKYDEEDAPWVFRYFDFEIEPGSVNCFVGKSGCGKTTLLNLLLAAHQLDEGGIKIGGVPLNDIVPSAWLEKCGVVQQDGYIFSTSIARNIAIGQEEIDGERLFFASKMAGVLSFIDRFRNGFQTKVGEGGVGLSKGQRQCILIARALYKNPDYLFLDEPTNDLDNLAEEQILKAIFETFEGKTVVIFSNRMFDNSFKINYIPMPENIQNILPGKRSVSGGGIEIPDGNEGFDLFGN